MFTVFTVFICILAFNYRKYRKFRTGRNLTRTFPKIVPKFVLQKVYRPISSRPFSAGCHGNRNWRPIWKVAWWARVSCRRSRMYGIQCKLVQFCPVIPYSTAFFFLSEPVSCQGQWTACSNGKRNRSFTKNIISNHLCSGGWNPYTDSNVFSSSAFFLSIAIRNIGVHHTVPGYIDQNVFGLQRTAKKEMVITSWKIVMQAHTNVNQPIERRAWHWSCA